MNGKSKNQEIIIYQTNDGKTKIDVRMEGKTIWLTQAQIAKLFERDISVISRHIKNIFTEQELHPKSNLQIMQIPFSDKPVTLYSLDVIITVGYRVKSSRGTQFRQWATSILYEYMQKGFSINDDFLKNMGGGLYFKELLDRIRDIRASEKVLYRQVLDLYATSIDYKASMPETIEFFSETHIAKNYMSEKELFTLRRMVNAFFDMAEIKAEHQEAMYMKDWLEMLDKFTSD